SGGQFNEADGLKNKLSQTLNVVQEKYGLEYVDSDLAVRFSDIIRQLYEKTGRQVVVLVDEYDKPLLSTMLSNPEQEEKNRELYKGFFSVLKDMDGYLKFVFFTGVTKFTKVSIFSDLNQLIDISMDDAYSGICGITEDEMRFVFKPEIGELSKAQDMNQDECIAELQKMYDGYHFSKNGVGVYNPFSLLNAFSKRDFGSYWFESGTPDILIKKLRQSKMPVYQLTDGVTAKESVLKDYRVDDPDPVPLFYQSGYLTICGYDRRFKNYKLRFPNDEVKYGFLDSLANDVFGVKSRENPLTLDRLIIDLESGDLNSFFKGLQALFASIPYPEGKAPQYEGEWSRQLFLILALMGAYMACEVHMATGRADCVVKTPDYIYVFEFKLDAPIEDAMNQIEDKGYAIPYIADSRKLYKVGVVFSSEKRNVADWKVVARK
ncbi:MAG TPA: AAA family ATPase, partial [Lachnospiraceae bacterium]|nr:AAA family ATPase [Lachnospiraceae bacterium]